MSTSTRASAEVSITEERVTLAGVPTRRTQVGGEGIPFLLIHGFADSADTWGPLMRRLGRAGRAAAAIDLAGFGMAGPPDVGTPLLGQWDLMLNAAIRDLSDAHGGGPVYIAGNSLGGCLSIRAAERTELPVGGIVPIAPAGLEMARWLTIIEGERMIKLLRRSPLPIPEPVVREFVGRVYANLAFSTSDSVDDAAVASFTRHIPSVGRGSAILDLGRRMLPELEDPFRLDRINCPLLLVWGDRDRMVYTGGAERVLRTVPYSDIEVIPNCGHCPQVELPDRLAAMLLDFPDGYEHP
ncbi:MAG TPA: alpha/beta hydrolase [Solirubrobacterales bacterium]|nr:alpha/beta hydrolase [Solirubrobacterales bacterium]